MPHTISRSFTLIYSLCTAMGLVACGGGGGGGGGSSFVTPPPMVTINGVAAKGLIKEGVVRIYTTDEAGNISELPIATTKTDGSGAYAVSIPAQSTALLATVTPSFDSTTKVANDLEPSKADSSLPADFKMSAVLGGAAANTSMSINPFTNLAVKSALRNGKLLSNYANITNQYVKTYFLNGIDPVTTLPSLSTKSNDPNELTMTAALLGVSVAAKDDPLCGTYSTVGEQYNCIITKISTSITINADTTITVTSKQVLTTLNTARKTLNTSPDYQALIKSLGVTAQVTALTNDNGLTSIVDGATSATATTPKLTFEEYVTDLKSALKNLKANLDNYGSQFQFSGLNYVRQQSIQPTLASVSNAFEFISNNCDFDGLGGISTCKTGSQTLSWGTVNIRATQANSYEWSGKSVGYEISGTLGVTTDNNSATFNLIGTIPSTDPDLSVSEPIEINIGFTMIKKEDGKYSATINSSTVKHPASYARSTNVNFPAFSASISNASLDATLFTGGWNETCDPVLGVRCFTQAAEKNVKVIENLSGNLTITDGWGDYAQLKVSTKMVTVSQTEWAAMSAYEKYRHQKHPLAAEISLMGTLSYVGVPSWYWGYGTVQASVNWKADFAGIDKTKPYSETNYLKGSLQFKEVLSSKSGSDGRAFNCSDSDACIDVLFQRSEYGKAQPSLSIYVGNFDKITIVPNNEGNAYSLDNTSIKTSAIPDNSWLNFEQLHTDNSVLSLKIYSSNHPFVLTLNKDSNGKYKEGIIQDKEKKTVGVVKDGLLYINGQIYSLI